MNRLKTLGLLVLAGAAPSFAETVFDTRTLFEEDPTEAIAAFAAGSGVILPNGGSMAQPFELGQNDTVSEVEISASVWGVPTRVLNAPLTGEIWDESGDGTPGEYVGTFGVLEEKDGPVVFDKPVSGLIPNRTYYAVFATEVRDSKIRYLTIGDVVGSDQTSGAAPLLLHYGEQTDNQWKLASEVLPGPDEYFPNSINDYLIMRIEASNSNELLGDFNGSGVLDLGDIDALTAEANSGKNNLAFDVNRDRFVTRDDIWTWIRTLKGTWIGDSDLDGEFKSGDLIHVSQVGQYEDDLSHNSTWSSGDWNGDLEFDSSDLIVAFQDGGYEQGQRFAQAVPEPGICLLLSIVVICGPIARK